MSSFSKSVKAELTNVRLHRVSDMKSLISGFTLAIASLRLAPGKRSWGVRYVSESDHAIAIVSKLIRQCYGLEQEFSVTEHERLRARNNELLVYGDGIDEFMIETGLTSRDLQGEKSYSPHIPSGLNTEHSQKAFVRGVFLACGSVASPEKGCHAELVCKNDMLASAVRDMLYRFGIEAKTTQRKGSSVVYIKDGDAVEDLLAYMGAGEAKLAVSEARMMREISNASNREVNCITANLDKATRASARIAEDIRILYSVMGADALPNSLAEVAEARINNPEMTLGELAEALGIGRSAVNYRLNKLSQLARSIENGG